jgi:ubiquinone/menaquinone biosynthesis C-methylase UbiE
MTRVVIPTTLLISILTALAFAAPEAGHVGTESSGIYTRTTPSRDGIGKVYMGREISFVMGHRGIDWLERASREREERTDLVVRNMELAADAVVADIGAGSGYFAFRISPAVPQGQVFAVDIQAEMLQALERRQESAGISNIEGVLGTPTDPNLAPASVDAALMVDAYHEFSNPREMMDGLVEALRPGGRVFLIEYRKEDPTVPILPLHKMSEAQARLEMNAVGLEFVENRAMLPQQHFLVFRKPGPVP